MQDEMPIIVKQTTETNFSLRVLINVLNVRTQDISNSSSCVYYGAQ